MYTPVRPVANRARRRELILVGEAYRCRGTVRGPMSQPELHDLLAGLHDELVATRSVDRRTRQELQHLADHIRSLLDEAPGPDTAARYRGLRERLGRAVTAFEASHPQLARRIEGAIDTLAMLNL
jgi:hypothetical protein